MDSISSLETSILQYEAQLSQIESAMSVTASGEERAGLSKLCTDLKELIALTRENINSRTQDQEYQLFKEALGENLTLEPTEPQQQTTTPDIGGELEALSGMKCQAPYKQQYGSGVTYHNAMVTSVDIGSTEGATDTSHIQVRVVFINPTHQAMRLCPYYLEGKCRFDDAKCRYSHDQLVPLSDLREYQEPDFSCVKRGSRVLAKSSEELWKCASVQEVEPSGECHVRFEESGQDVQIELHSLLPLNDEDDLSELSSDEEDICTDDHVLALANQILMNKGPSVALGAWEQYTRGIGSKLMAQMGYITGAGLGKRGEGKVEPVETQVLPPRKSLDHIMRLKEKSCGDKDLVKIERRKRHRLKKQHEKKYQREKERTPAGNVFDFINSYLKPTSSTAATASTSAADTTRQVKSESRRGLNVRGLQLSEEIRKAEKEVSRLEQSVARIGAGSSSGVAKALVVAKSNLESLTKQQQSLEAETSRRRDQHKMVYF